MIDTSLLLYILNEATQAPDDPVTGKPVENCVGRVNQLIADFAKKREKLFVPTPALAESLVRAGSAAPEYLRILEAHRAIQLADFNGLAAVEAAAMMADIYGSGNKLTGDARVKMKFDVMIAAIAKVNNSATIYSDDTDIGRLGKRYGFTVIGIAQLPEPPAETLDLFNRIDTGTDSDADD